MSQPPTPQLTPLITAAEVFPALERMVLGARTEVLMAFRIFDPDTRLRSEEAQHAGLQNWGELIAGLCQRGVRVRLLIADFDPLFGAGLHREATRCAAGFADSMSGDSDILCARHGQQAGWVWQKLMRPKIHARITELQASDTPLTPVQTTAIRQGDALYPATLHQKFAVVDGDRAIVGGLDINERRWDDHDHAQRAEDTWHDVSVAVSGAVCADLRGHFVTCWNTALAQGARGRNGTADPLEHPQTQSAAPQLQMVRTLSQPRKGALVLAPKSDLTEHERWLIAHIAQAREYIHLETQFFRHLPIARALVQAARAQPRLQLIMLVPTAPERVEFQEDFSLDARFAQGLQIRNVELCQRAFGDRMAIVSPRLPRRPHPDEGGALSGEPLIYVHSKVALIDDRWGLIGSANLNGRSMHWDTEVSVGFDDPETTRTLHERLARLWLGETVTQTRLAQTWLARARDNAAAAPEEQAGFVIPYPLEINRKFSLRWPLLPADMF